MRSVATSARARGEVRRRFFPAESRHFPGQRWCNIGFRTLHLIGIAGLGGGFLYPSLDDEWLRYLYLTLVSGSALVFLSLWSNGVWLVQLRGQAVLLKVLLLALMRFWPDLRLPLFVMVILVSGVFAHAPARVRYFSVLHGRRIDRL